MTELDKTYWSMPVVQDDDHANNFPNSPDISIEIVNDVTAIPSLEEEWDKLALNSSATIFQTFDWQYQWWRHFADKPDHHLFIVLFKIEERLVGIAPFFIQSYLFRHYRFFMRLMLLGSGLQKSQSPVLSLEKEGPSDYLDIIVEHGLEKEVANALVNFIKRESYLWNEIDFQNIKEDGIIFNYVLPKLAENNFTITKTVTDICPRFLLPESVEKFISSMRPKVRRNLRYVQRNYLANPEFTLVDISDEKNVTGAIESLLQLHQKRWNAIGYPGLFSDRCFDTF
ncbi:MAG: hypothetical protein WAO19_12995, partial [Candidatus Kryptoniota bacterium]